MPSSATFSSVCALSLSPLSVVVVASWSSFSLFCPLGRVVVVAVVASVVVAVVVVVVVVALRLLFSPIRQQDLREPSF